MQKGKKAVVWLRNDLRALDNKALSEAARRFEEIIPVYIFNEDVLRGSAHQSKRIGSRRVKFILEALADLSEQLGGQIIITEGRAEDILPNLAKRYEAEAIFAHRHFAPYEIREEEELRASLPSEVSLELFWGNMLFDLNDLPFELNDLPDVFTPFRKICEKQATVRDETLRPSGLKIAELRAEFDIPTCRSLGFDEPLTAVSPVLDFQGGETAALERLEHYFFKSRSLQSYKETRNGLLGADYSSKFSPWLALGCISPRTIYHEVRRYEKEIKKNSSTYWMIFELFWREYFAWVTLKYGAKLFTERGIKNLKQESRENDDYLNAWKAGKTGVPFVDANMRELNETGFMSNRGRQNVASFLMNELRLDWRQGAAYFEEQLIDYDPCSNWSNWAYIAGVGNDPVEKRWFNQITQAKRYDSEAAYVKSRISELRNLAAQDAHQPWLLSHDALVKNGLDQSIYANPLVLPQRGK